MKRGDIEYQGKVFENQKGDWKDEFVLLTVTLPMFLLAYSVFAEDEEIQNKIDLYFETAPTDAVVASFIVDQYCCGNLWNKSYRFS